MNVMANSRSLCGLATIRQILKRFLRIENVTVRSNGSSKRVGDSDPFCNAAVPFDARKTGRAAFKQHTAFCASSPRRTTKSRGDWFETKRE